MKDKLWKSGARQTQKLWICGLLSIQCSSRVVSLVWNRDFHLTLTDGNSRDVEFLILDDQGFLLDTHCLREKSNEAVANKMSKTMKQWMQKGDR